MDLRLSLRGRQIEQGFLDVRRELIESHYLAHSRLSHMPTSSQLDRVRKPHRCGAFRRIGWQGPSALRYEVCDWWALVGVGFSVGIVRTDCDATSRGNANVQFAFYGDH